MSNIISLDNFDDDDSTNSTIEKKKLQAQLKALELAEAEEKSGKKDKSASKERYTAFMSAKAVYDDCTMSFYRDREPKYFYKLLTEKKDKKENTIRVQEIRYFSHGSLYPNFTNLKSDLSRTMLRQLMEGGTFNIQNPNGSLEQYTFDRRVYDKMANTIHRVDDKTYNLVNLSDRVTPKESTTECPLIFKALTCALTGNILEWSEIDNEWKINKPDTLEWLEKWIYGAAYRNIGDIGMSMPIIFGPGKVGKNALFDIIFRQILGSWLCFSGTWDVIGESNFNQFKLGRTFMFIDEIPPMNDWSKVKNLTGSPTTYIKEKYGAEFEVDNCIVMAFGSNSLHYPLPWEDGEQMMRVSPIKTTGASTFAGNFVKLATKEFGNTYVDDLITAVTDGSIDVTTLTDFNKGDYLLRYVLNKEWQSREFAQQVIDYLHTKYGANEFHLAPLRSTDWSEIENTKVNGIDLVIEFMENRNPELITEAELYEIYKVAVTDEKKRKNQNNFRAEIELKMMDIGYNVSKNTFIANKRRETIFYKVKKHGQFGKHVIDLNNYISRDISGGIAQQTLIWDTTGDAAYDATNDENINQRLKEFLTRKQSN